MILAMLVWFIVAFPIGKNLRTLAALEDHTVVENAVEAYRLWMIDNRRDPKVDYRDIADPIEVAKKIQWGYPDFLSREHYEIIRPYIVLEGKN